MDERGKVASMLVGELEAGLTWTMRRGKGAFDEA
jgi:hypothetical protein